MTTVGPRTAHARTARSRRTREQLVTAVRDELRSTGSFTADSVAARAGCSTATFYSHFGSKDDAVAAAFAHVLHDMVERSMRALSTDTLVQRPLSDAVARYVESQAEFFREESLVFRAALNRLPHHRPIREAYRKAERATLARLEHVITEGQREGIMRPGDVATLAEAVLVMAQGINNPRVIRPDARALRAVVARAITATIAAADTP